MVAVIINAKLAYANDCADLLGQNSGAEIAQLKHGVYVNAIAWSPDGKYLASLDQREHFLYIWQIAGNKLLYKKFNPSGVLAGLTFTSDGRFVLASAFEPTGERAFSVWNLSTGEKIIDVQGPPRETRDGNNNANKIAASPDGKYIVALHFGGNRFTVYDASTWKIVNVVRFQRPAKYVAAISPDSARIAVGGGYGHVEVYNLTTGQLLSSFVVEPKPKGGGRVHGLDFSPDGKILAVGSQVDINQPSMQLRLWDAMRYELIREYLTDESHEVRSLSYSPDGLYVATVGGSHPTRIRVWDANSTRMVGEIRPSDQTAVVAFSPTNNAIAYGDGSSVHVCSLKSAGK